MLPLVPRNQENIPARHGRTATRRFPIDRILNTLDGHFPGVVTADTGRAGFLFLLRHGVILLAPENRKRRLDSDGQARYFARPSPLRQPPRRVVPLRIVRAALPVAVLPLAGIAEHPVKFLVPRGGRHVEGIQNAASASGDAVIFSKLLMVILRPLLPLSPSWGGVHGSAGSFGKQPLPARRCRQAGSSHPAPRLRPLRPAGRDSTPFKRCIGSRPAPPQS